MPLTRDTIQTDGQPPADAEGFHNNRQQMRLNYETKSSHPVRTESPQDDTRQLTHNREVSLDKHENLKTGKQYALDPEDVVGNDFKVPISNAFPPKQEKAKFQRPQGPPARQNRITLNPKGHQTQPMEKSDTFDNTESLNMSSLDDFDYNEDENTPQKPQSQASQRERGHYGQADYKQQGRPKVSSSAHGIGIPDPNYHEITNQGREVLNIRGIATEYGLKTNLSSQSSKPNERNRRDSFDSDSNLPDTPSRSRSAPIHGDIVAPVPRKVVAIDSSPQFMSPVLRSEDLAREQSPDPAQTRPRSALSGARGTTLVQRSQQRQPLPHSHLRESQTAAPARFQMTGSYINPAHMRGQKVSAPESDVPESSEDERPQQSEARPTHAVVTRCMDQKLVAGRKRSYEEVSDLDYNHTELGQKSLAELQSEPFTKDPKSDSGPQIDSLGNRLNLSTIFERMSKMSDDTLKDVFQSQTDDEWAQTGQWFVECFQADLKELMEVRLARRKIAMDYEHKIRRRQREVEHYEAGVKQELKELGEGGNGLLRDRKMTSSSRSNTPMKPVRQH